MALNEAEEASGAVEREGRALGLLLAREGASAVPGGGSAAFMGKRHSAREATASVATTRNDQQAVAVLGQIHTVRRARLLRAAQSLADARAAVVAPPAEAGLVWFRRKRRARKLARGELQVVFDGGEVVRTIGMEQ
jgi:hypothetical protein